MLFRILLLISSILSAKPIYTCTLNNTKVNLVYIKDNVYRFNNKTYILFYKDRSPMPDNNKFYNMFLFQLIDSKKKNAGHRALD